LTGHTAARVSIIGTGVLRKGGGGGGGGEAKAETEA
jgi:hypothetical protein